MLLNGANNSSLVMPHGVKLLVRTQCFLERKQSLVGTSIESRAVVLSGGGGGGGDWPSQGTRFSRPLFRGDVPNRADLRHRITGSWSWNEG